MFLFKKIAGPFFLPLSLCLELLFIGLFLLWFTEKQRAGKILVSLGLLCLVLISYDLSANLLLQSLESRYPPDLSSRAISEVKWIVVLGGGHRLDERLPANERLSSTSLARLIEGLRLQRQAPQSRLLLSGGPVFGGVAEAEVMAETARELGTRPEQMRLESFSKDTESQAEAIRKIVLGDPFLLVTSAAHLPRSLALFQKAGMNPRPAPADYQVKEDPFLRPSKFFPSVEALGKSQTAFYEYLGWSWAMAQNKI